MLNNRKITRILRKKWVKTLIYELILAKQIIPKKKKKFPFLLGTKKHKH